MRNLDFKTPPGPGEDGARIARLTRHLRARLLDFPPGGPDVLRFSEEEGVISARLPGGNCTAQAELLLKTYGISADVREEALVFHLRQDTRFEDLDFLWGCLFDLMH